MNTRLTKLILSLAVVLSFTLSTAHAAVVTIDDFAAGVPLSTFGTSSVVDDGLHSGVLGGYRDTQVFAISGGLNIFYSPVVGNTVAFDGLAGSSGFYSSTYDGVGLGTGSLNLDLLGIVTSGQFSLVVLDANGTGNAFVNVVDNNGKTFTTSNVINNGFVGVLDFDYSNYLLAGVDLSDIKSISLLVSSSGIADDFTFGVFTATQVVPEPATLSLLGLGGLMFLRRRNRERLA